VYQNINASFLTLPKGASRGAVLGTLNGGNDLFSFHLNAGQSVTLGSVLSANSGVLSAPTSVANGSFTQNQAVAAGDLNGDGKTDLVVANINGRSISVFMGNGDGTFQPPQTYFLNGFFPDGVALADLRGTGKLDIVVSVQFNSSFTDGEMDVLFNNGDGTFGLTQSYATHGPAPQGLVVGNFAGNGKKDVAVVDFSSFTTFGSVSVFLNNGDGTFGTPSVFHAGNGADGIAAADLRGTGKDDIVVSDFNNDALTSGGLTVLLNDGTGTHFSSTDLNSGGNGAGGVAIGDLAGNGKEDIVVANGFSSTLSVLAGNGDGTFAAPTIYAASFPWAVALADLGHRGKPDIVTANFFGSVSVLLNNGDGTFAAHQDFAGGDSHHGHQALALGDFNGDGFLDVASLNSNTPTLSVELSQFSLVSLQLLDANGNVLQTATAGPSNLNLAISDFIAPADGTYYARFTSVGLPRGVDLVVTRGADFDTHPNGTFATAQDITGTVGALGAIVATGSATSADWYRVTAKDGQTLFFDTTIPSTGPGQFTDNLQPHIELFDPSGTLVASGVVQADGRNEAITFTVPTGAVGAYRVLITGKNGTTGEYFLDPIESSGPPTGVLTPAAGAAGVFRIRVTGKSGTTGEHLPEPVGSGGPRATVLPPAGVSASSRGTGLSAADFLSALGMPAAQGPIPADGGNPTTPPPGLGRVPANGLADPALAGPGLAASDEKLSLWAIDQLFTDHPDSDGWPGRLSGLPTGEGEPE
jgi:hypothetical protein